MLKRQHDYKSHSLLELIKTPGSDPVFVVLCFSLKLCVPIMLVAKCSSAGVTLHEETEILCRGELA